MEHAHLYFSVNNGKYFVDYLLFSAKQYFMVTENGQYNRAVAFGDCDHVPSEYRLNPSYIPEPSCNSLLAKWKQHSC